VLRRLEVERLRNDHGRGAPNPKWWG
jgi:hypothetical protein